MLNLTGESPVLTIVRSGQVVISGIRDGNKSYESPEVNGQSAGSVVSYVGTTQGSNKMESLSIKRKLPHRNRLPARSCSQDIYLGLTLGIRRGNRCA